MSLRVTGGSMRGRRFAPPQLPGLRPTPAKVREALFSMLGDIAGWRVLDLYAGSGIMSLEALSRGASEAVAVERSRRAAGAMIRLARAFGLDVRWRVLSRPVATALAGELAGSRFELVFADPPYRSGIARALPRMLAASDIGWEWLAIEAPAELALACPEGCRPHRERRYGDTRLWLFRRVTA
ncbi:MAG: 16S rRNA (guanine(966)-N(2))-methyltransferase RsmD [Mariprofundaceae bacterium]